MKLDFELKEKPELKSEFLDAVRKSIKPGIRT
jgi:uncharacterized protein YnzC (UPF0291/DUF896 family)